MAIHVDIQPTVPVVIDDTKDAVVIDSVTKIFKKSRPLLRWRKKDAEKKAEKREVRAVDNVTMTIKRREIVGILGSNGSGKSTVIRILSTLLIPDSGHVTIFGYDVEKDARCAVGRPGIRGGVIRGVLFGLLARVHGRRRWCARGAACSAASDGRRRPTLVDGVRVGRNVGDVFRVLRRSVSRGDHRCPAVVGRSGIVLPNGGMPKLLPIGVMLNLLPNGGKHDNPIHT